MKPFLFALLALPLSLLAEGGLPTQPYIYVVGSAEVQKPADMATLRFHVVARAPEEAKANEEVQAKANKIFVLLKERKITDNDVIAESLHSEPQFESEENYQKRGKVIGHTVTRPFEVKVRDITAFPKLADELIAIGGVEFSSIDGGLQKEKEMQEEMWGKALTNAREQADKTLKVLGMKIDSVFAVSPVSFPEIQPKIFSSERLGVRGAQLGVQTIPQYRLAEVKLTQSVHVIYLISPAK